LNYGESSLFRGGNTAYGDGAKMGGGTRWNQPAGVTPDDDILWRDVTGECVTLEGCESRKYWFISLSRIRQDAFDQT